MPLFCLEVRVLAAFDRRGRAVRRGNHPYKGRRMRKPFLALLTGALVVVLSVGAGASVAGANGQGRGHADDRANVGHNLETPLSKEQAANRTKGLELQLQGKVKKGEKVAKLPN